MTSTEAAPLAGLLVVAMEQAVAAPLCTARLVDAGARVIKLERSRGDFARGYDTAAGGDSSYFAWLNHGKESLHLDFKLKADAELLHRLLAKADVFVQNLAPGSLARQGFGDDALRKRYPSLITCNISGYGDAENVRNLKAYDLLVQAESGLLAVSGVPDQPGRIGVSLCDIGCGVTAHAAILEALIRRGITQAGSSLKVSLFDVAAEWMSVPLIHAETGAGAPQPSGLRHPSIAPYGAYRTHDGALTLLSIQNEEEWVRLCNDALDLPHLVTDPRYVDNNRRVQNRDALESELEQRTTQWNSGEFRNRLSRARIAFGALNSVDELGSHPALSRRSIKSSTGEALSLPAHPFQKTLPATAVPLPGEHSTAIRKEFAS